MDNPPKIRRELWTDLRQTTDKRTKAIREDPKDAEVELFQTCCSTIHANTNRNVLSVVMSEKFGFYE